MILYILYLAAIILCGSVNIGPVSVRVIATGLMITYLVIFKPNKIKHINIDKSYIAIYLIFSMFMGLALILNGEFIQFEFIKKFLAFNLVAIVAFLSIDRLIGNYHQLKIVIITLLSIILFNNIITILQYNSDPIGWAVGFLFGDISDSIDKMGTRDDLLGMSVTPGIFGDVVKNALYIAVITPLSLCIINNRSHFPTIIFSYIIIVTSLIAAFMTQQRAAFALMILIVILYFILSLRSNPIILIGLIFLSTVIGLISINYISNIDIGRLSDNSDSTRSKLISYAIEYIIDHPILGGPVRFISKTGFPAHNFILDTYIYSGILGFPIMMILFGKTMFKSIYSFFTGLRLNSNGYLLVYSSTAVLFCMAYGFLHNTSFLSGEVIVFILLAIMLKAENLSKLRYKANPSVLPLVHSK